jgi:hypothetical protein
LLLCTFTFARIFERAIYFSHFACFVEKKNLTTQNKMRANTHQARHKKAVRAAVSIDRVTQAAARIEVQRNKVNKNTTIKRSASLVNRYVEMPTRQDNPATLHDFQRSMLHLRNHRPWHRFTAGQHLTDNLLQMNKLLFIAAYVSTLTNVNNRTNAGSWQPVRLEQQVTKANGAKYIAAVPLSNDGEVAARFECRNAKVLFIDPRLIRCARSSDL